MTISLTMACIWAFLANILAALPSKDGHWTCAYVLIALGIPLVGFVTYENGPWVGLVVLVAGMSVMRWPVRYVWRWTTERMVAGRVDG
ncbi:DUF2484 family protein [Allosediminivita pacifica]|uniref:Uncharacterized protein DUF2484 n=1 Tax=Allosediminivita pacifica TaxID=1267769 RepID=A0A2T6B255_9RHOB|nr:DUF2484 family protein [Allosediminivita pacifica]PTX50156.1 uncharacterized protein DUF2484 [Allosediminivita pacifica]GGB01810.1 hypothetical protein GCM10011324_10120 [Allosediminivita pacifica]